jgi:pilus assembly protein Flp/PilA
MVAPLQRTGRFRRWSDIRRRFAHDEGASLSEYAILLGVLALALVLVITQFRGAIGNAFERSTNSLASANASAGSQGDASAGGGGAAGGSTGNNGGGQGNGNGQGNQDGKDNGNDKKQDKDKDKGKD